MNPELEKVIAAIRANGGTEDDVADYLQSLGGKEVKPEGPSDRERTARANAREATSKAEREALNTASTSFINFLDAGTFGLAGLATDALSPGSFRANRDARQAIYNEIPTGERMALGLAGGLLNPVSKVPGLGQGGSLLRIAGRGAATGAAMGAAQGIGENVGTTSGATIPALQMAAGGALLGGALAPAAARFAQVGPKTFFDPLTQNLPDFLGGGAAKARRTAELTRNAASGRAAAAARADADLGDARMNYELPKAPMFSGRTGRLSRPTIHTLPPSPASGMDLDRAGPSMLSQARGATGTVPGREAFRGPFAAREAEITSGLTKGVPDAVQTGERLRAERAAQADADYGAAIEATKGQPVETPSLDALLETPTGKAAWRAVQTDRPDLVLGVGDPNRALPQVEKPSLLNPNALFEVQESPFGPPPAEMRTVPDAEAIHELTRYLRKWSSGEKGQVFPEGVSAISASNALKLLERAQSELPEPFRIANENYAEASKAIDALELGRTPWTANPNPLRRRAEPLAKVEKKVARMAPENAALVREGKQFDLATRVNEGRLTPRRAVEQMDRPGSSLGREMGIAGGPLPARLRAADDVLERQKAVLPRGLLALEPETGGAVTQVAENMRPSWFWTAQKYLKDVLGNSAAQTVAQRGREDAAFANLLTGDPGDTQRAIAYFRARDKAAGVAAEKIAATAGRVGLLGR